MRLGCFYQRKGTSQMNARPVNVVEYKGATIFCSSPMYADGTNAAFAKVVGGKVFVCFDSYACNPWYEVNTGHDTDPCLVVIAAATASTH
jgi:hypothetical protein